MAKRIIQRFLSHFQKAPITVFSKISAEYDKMTQAFTSPLKKKGLPPGTVVYVGEPKKEEVALSIIDYAKHECVEKKDVGLKEALTHTHKNRWIDVDGVHDIELVKKLGAHFNLHPLLIEDICNTHQRPKVDFYDNAVFVVLKMLLVRDGKIHVEQVSFIVTDTVLISFQETSGDVFDPIRTRLRLKHGFVHDHGVDYLAYALIDSIIDNYYVLLEHVGDEVEFMEEKILEKTPPEFGGAIHALKQEILLLRRSVWPVRDVVNSLSRDESHFIKKTTRVFFRDVYDHTVQVIDSIETYRDTSSGLLELYMSMQNTRMNEVMKVLTIFTAIFVPLNLVAGIYGMNFHYMPGIASPYGFFMIVAGMIVAGMMLLAVFRYKRWM